MASLTVAKHWVPRLALKIWPANKNRDLTMAAREKSKAKRSSGNKSAQGKSTVRKSSGKRKAPEALTEAVARLEAELRALQAERDQLRAQLAAAKSQIAELEGMHTKAVDRIDWVIDSLHNVLEGNA